MLLTGNQWVEIVSSIGSYAGHDRTNLQDLLLNTRVHISAVLANIQTSITTLNHLDHMVVVHSAYMMYQPDPPQPHGSGTFQVPFGSDRTLPCTLARWYRILCHPAVHLAMLSRMTFTCNDNVIAISACYLCSCSPSPYRVRCCNHLDAISVTQRILVKGLFYYLKKYTAKCSTWKASNSADAPCSLIQTRTHMAHHIIYVTFCLVGVSLLRSQH